MSLCSSQKDVKASPQVNGKDSELSKGKCDSCFMPHTQSEIHYNIIIHVFTHYVSAAAVNLQSPDAAVLSPSQSVSAPVVNGVQPAAHQNGVSANGEAADFEEIIQLNNSGNPAQTQSGLVSEPILAFEGGEPFLMKTGPMKPQHVAGTEKRRQIEL